MNSINFKPSTSRLHHTVENLTQTPRTCWDFDGQNEIIEDLYQQLEGFGYSEIEVQPFHNHLGQYQNLIVRINQLIRNGRGRCSHDCWRYSGPMIMLVPWPAY